MNIHQLRCAVTVARLGSQTRAAEELYMSQPNLSKALKDLEQTCGFRIFTRTGTGMAPTRRGEEFLEHARAVLEKLDLMDAIYQGQDRRSANLSVAVCGAGYLTRALCAFLDETNPAEGLEINMREGRVEEVVRAVLDREAEIGVIRYVWTGRTGCWPLWGSRGCIFAVLELPACGRGVPPSSAGGGKTAGKSTAGDLCGGRARIGTAARAAGDANDAAATQARACVGSGDPAGVALPVADGIHVVAADARGPSGPLRPQAAACGGHA